MKALIAFDGSDAAKLALQFLAKSKQAFEQIYVLYVTPAIMGSGPTFDAYVPSTVYVKQDEAADKIISVAEEMLKDSEIKAEFIKLDGIGDQVAKVIVRNAEEKGVDLIVCGTRKLSGLTKVILGSVSSEIIKISKLPVLIYPPPE